MAKTKAAGFVINRGVRVSGATIAEREATSEQRRLAEKTGKPLRRANDEVLVAGDEDRLAELIGDGTIDRERLERLGAIQDASELPKGATGRPARGRRGTDRRMARALDRNARKEAGNEAGTREAGGLTGEAAEQKRGGAGGTGTVRGGAKPKGGGDDEGGGNEGPFPDDYPATEAQRKALLEAGYEGPEDVEAAEDDELLGIDGIGEKTVEAIRSYKPAE